MAQNSIKVKFEKKLKEKLECPDKKYRYSPEEIERRLKQASQKGVRELFGNTILFTASDIFNIAIAMRKVDMDYYRIYIPKLRLAFKHAKQNQMFAYQMDKFEQKLFMDMLITGSTIRESYETLYYLMEWFGLYRMTNLKFNVEIPPDNRPGIYDNDQYDGTQWYEFVDQTFQHPEEYEEAQHELVLKQNMEYWNE